MGERKNKLAQVRVKLLKEAIERMVTLGVAKGSLLEEVLGDKGSASFVKCRDAFTNNELCFMSVVLDRCAIPYGHVDPLMLYRHRHYSLKLYNKDKKKLAILACEHMLNGLSQRLNSVATLLNRDLEILGISGTTTVDKSGRVDLWVESYRVSDTLVLTSQCGDLNYKDLLPFQLITSLEQIFHAAQMKRGIQCFLGLT